MSVRKRTLLWIGLFVEFLILELTGQLSSDPKPRTASEHLWRLFPRGWKRVLLVLGLTALLIHIAIGPDVKPVYYQQGDASCTTPLSQSSVPK